ncbi:hypothetical protein ACSBRB_05820 [Staphylococcus auricularis]|uniref:hypothetical protein n=1 Tax=Staphylococcus auricularis TaxID=29379 RepID=UPI003EBD8F4E
MDKKQVIKTIITVAPVFLVPLITGRKRFKNHPDVQKVTRATTQTSKTVAHKTVDAKNYVVDKKHQHDQKRELKRIAKEHDPAYIKKKGKKLAKQNLKEANKLDKRLQKSIDQRHKAEEKAQQKNKKQRLSELKKYEKHHAKSEKEQQED